MGLTFLTIAFNPSKTKEVAVFVGLLSCRTTSTLLNSLPTKKKDNQLFKGWSETSQNPFKPSTQGSNYFLCSSPKNGYKHHFKFNYCSEQLFVDSETSFNKGCNDGNQLRFN